MSKIIGIAGTAFSGKNTFAKCIKKCFPDYHFQELSLAEQLKKEMEQEIYDKYKVSVFTQDSVQKALFRDDLVQYAAQKRAATQGRYFIDILDKKVRRTLVHNKIPIITDIRFSEYLFDEVDWLIKNNGFLVHVTKYIFDQNKIFPLGPANEAEKINDPKLIVAANARVVWPENQTVQGLVSKSFKYIAPAISQIEEYLHD